jgi:site-specific recombinase XerD
VRGWRAPAASSIGRRRTCSRRAYAHELGRLITWCRDHELGPLSDLTREELLAFRQTLVTHRAAPGNSVPAPSRTAGHSDATRARALAVVSSLFGYWQRTGYLLVNPAAGLASGASARATWTPGRILPAAVISLCDAVIAGEPPANIGPVRWARRCAIWSLYRYGGVRLAELEWSSATGLPQLTVEPGGAWTLHVRGKGGKLRAIPLPAVCVPALCRYRLARGLLAEPAPLEQLPPVHSERGAALGHSGLYDEVKAVLFAARAHVAPGDTATLALLRAASTHWLRHGYARTLVVEHAVPLPVAQALLGHASVQTTAAYARTDLGARRAFVEASFKSADNGRAS